MGEDLMLYKDLQVDNSAFSIATARTGARTCPMASSSRPGCARNYHGWLARRTRPATASSSPMTTPPTRARALKERCKLQGLSGEGAGGAACGPIWVHSRCPNCRSGRRSPSRRASAKSSSRTCPATGSSARRTPAIRCTSSGCTTTGACGSRPRRSPMPPSTSQLKFEEFDYGFLYKRVREGADESNPLGPSAGSACGRSASTSESISNGACRLMTRIR